MQRTVFNEDHESFRKTLRDFIAKEVVPQYPDWEEQGHPPRRFYNRLGDLGVLGIKCPASEIRFMSSAVQVDASRGGGGSRYWMYLRQRQRSEAPPGRRNHQRISDAGH